MRSFLLAVLTCVTSTRDYSQFGNHRNQADMETARALLQSGKCKHVYLDLGTNVGVQIRKLYHPDQFPNASVLPYFDSYFGPKENRKDVCAFGFEPNARWTRLLKRLQAKLNGASFNNVIFTETAVGTKNGNVTFYIDETVVGKRHNNWASSMYQWNKQDMRSEVSGMLDIVSFIKYEIMQRTGQVPSSTIFVKLDVEGAEYEIIPAMLKADVFCMIDAVAAEFHPRFVNGAMSRAHYLKHLDKETKRRPGCKIKVIALDDETYSNEPEEE